MKERNKGAECYRFGKCLPETIKHICYLPKEPSEFRNQKPHNPARCIKLLAYPDPPNSTCATVRGWLRHHSPNFFSDGAIKEVLKVQRSGLMSWRKHALRDYCKKNNLAISSLPDPMEPQEPVFTSFGPKNNLLDNLDRILRANDLSPGWTIKAFGRAFIIGIIGGVLLKWQFISPYVKVLSLISIIIFDYLLGFIARSVDCLSEIRRASHNPTIFIFENGKLSLLLKNLKAVEHELKHYFPGAMVSISKSRPHPSKQAYSIRIVAHLMLNELISPLFTHPEILTFNIEIVAQSIKDPPILCYWFDLPKSIMMARCSLALVNFVKDRMNEMIKDIDEHSKLVFLHNTTDVDSKVRIPYGPFNLRI